MELPFVNHTNGFAFAAGDVLGSDEVDFGPDAEHGAQGGLEALFHPLDLAHQVGELIRRDLDIDVEGIAVVPSPQCYSLRRSAQIEF